MTGNCTLEFTRRQGDVPVFPGVPGTAMRSLRLPVETDRETFMPAKGRTETMADEPFALIEKKIGDVAGIVETLRREKAELSAELGRKDEEIKEMERKVAELVQERNEIRARVEKILSRLETIEL
jgi:chromosome segregation ATPase